MTETEIKTQELIKKVGGIENFRIISMDLAEKKALELAGRPRSCQNRPLCRDMEKSLKDLLEKDPSIEEEIMKYVFG
jgi:hypothetical protein